jgi:hypothetical protein
MESHGVASPPKFRVRATGVCSRFQSRSLRDVRTVGVRHRLVYRVKREATFALLASGLDPTHRRRRVPNFLQGYGGYADDPVPVAPEVRRVGARQDTGAPTVTGAARLTFGDG